MSTARFGFVALVAAGAVIVSVTACQPGQGRSAGGATPSTVVARGSSSHVISVDGRQRTFRLYVPPALPAQIAVPLVVMLHGGFGTAEQAEEAYGWDAEADRSGFVVAYPDGWHRAWAVGGGCCGQPGREDVDDVAFVQQVVATVGALLPIDPARVYATGISNGGMLSYRLACDTKLFAAIGPVAGTQLGECAPASPISIIHIHGLADRNIPYDGRPGEGFAKIDGPPVPDVIAAWRAAGGCAEPSDTTSQAVTRSVAQCPAGRAVELIGIEGAGHQWPGAKPKSVAEKALGLDPPSASLNATNTIWQFFAAHPKQA